MWLERQELKKSSKTYYGGGIPRCVKITFNSRFNEGDEERLIFFQIIIRRVNEYAFYSAAVGEFSVFGVAGDQGVPLIMNIQHNPESMQGIKDNLYLIKYLFHRYNIGLISLFNDQL